MKEITRIHIAKTQYDVELGAKKALESYLKTLESYSDDTEIINDIEIRITEILSERGVAKGGVISDSDVAALKQQLGEPRDFMGDGDIAIGPDDEDDEPDENNSPRKLFRDTDRGVIGGVLAGIAAFYKVNPVWTRLLFILIALMSGGAAVLVYVVLWIAVPPARTAADKLQMAGKSVTAQSIRRFNESDAKTVRRTDNSKRVASVIMGTLSVIVASSAAMMTSVIATGVIFGGYQGYLNQGEAGGYFVAAFVLAVISGVLLTVLGILAAYASFAQKMTKRVLVSICVVIVVGLASFGTAIGLAQYGSVRYSNELKANMHESQITLPEGVSKAKKLSVDSQNVLVQYVVSSETPTATIRSAFTNPQDNNSRVSVEVENDTLVVKSEAVRWDICRAFWCDGGEPVIVIYGPELESINAERKSTVEYSAQSQADLTVNTDESAELHITEGTVKTLHLTADNKSEITALDATITRVEATIKSGATLEFGTIESLALNDQKSCPRGIWSTVEVWKISDEKMTINGTEVPARTDTLSCTKIAIESEEE